MITDELLIKLNRQTNLKKNELLNIYKTVLGNNDLSVLSYQDRVKLKNQFEKNTREILIDYIQSLIKLLVNCEESKIEEITSNLLNKFLKEKFKLSLAFLNSNND